MTVRGDNLDGDIQKLFASWDRIRIDLFGGQNSALRELTQTATKWLDTLQQWVTNNPELTATLITVAGAIAVLLGGLAGIGTFIVPALSAINMLMSGAALLGGIFSGVGSAIAAAFAALGLPLLRSSPLSSRARRSFINIGSQFPHLLAALSTVFLKHSRRLKACSSRSVNCSASS
ncbi:Phage-related minor tail protein [Serratia rubidaea]|uniref:Phage-related minor tail protein n=1 Tax=Serratia rubidaea TaxID=61652 RepID=A0A4U9HA05_SERRU|nr:Phage-related minor tail protein [Serratia rubidaea]